LGGVQKKSGHMTLVIPEWVVILIVVRICCSLASNLFDG